MKLFKQCFLHLTLQGRKFLNSLIFEKEMKIRYKAMGPDGTVVVQAECGLLDVGEEVAKKGFAERCPSPIKSNSWDTKKDAPLYQPRNAKGSSPLWGTRGSPPASFKGGLGDQVLSLNGRNESNSTNPVPLIR